MIEQLFALLQQAPVVSIIAGAVLTGFLAFVFKAQLIELFMPYIKKRFNLYNDVEIIRAINKAEELNMMIKQEDQLPLKSRIINALHEQRKKL